MSRTRIHFALSLLCLTLLALSRQAAAAPYDPPAFYYNSATGTGSALKSQLNSIIDGHSTYSYDSLRSILQITDADPNQPGHMILVYNDESLNVAAINPGGSIPGWDNGNTWNREHTWPKSRGLGSTGAPDGSDLHHIRASRTSVNSARDNTNFGGAFGQPYGEVNDGGATYWYPGDTDAGAIARAQFYMTVRYDGVDSGTEDLELGVGNVSNVSGSNDPPPQLGNLTRLVEWHYQAVPDDFERRRNQIIYDDYQHNRNPFIDHPEYVWSIFKDQQNDSQLYVGAGPSGNGSSSQEVNLGSVLVGAAVPSAQNVTLHKNGLDGTYYEVTPSGSATSSVTGRFNAFPILTSGTSSKNLSVGLNTTTSTAGLRSGSVSIDNLDITTSGGSGHGANDANDSINVSLHVLDHANPSFSLASDINTLALDFGTVTMGSTMPTLDFDIANLMSTAGFTAGLDLDSILPAGDTGILSTDLATFTGASALDAGLTNSFTAMLDTSAVGMFSASYTLNFSDEDLAGAIGLGSLNLSLTGNVEAALVDSADFDEDGDIDGEDFLIWQRGYSPVATATHGEGDANNDMVVDGEDLTIWQNQYGTPPAPLASATAVPEPSGLSLLILSGVLAEVALATRKRRG